MMPMPAEPPDAAAPRRWQKWLVAGLGALVVVHSVLVALWLAPSSPVRDVVGSDHLASYVDPYFQQGRDAVGPSAQFVDESLRVRAIVRVDGEKEPRTTKWVDVTDDENDALRRDLDPARVHLAARRLATNLNLAMFGLTPEQRKIVRDTKATVLPSELKAALEKAGPDPVRVRTFLAYDQMAQQFVGLYARARWDGDIVQVQYQAGRRTVPPLADGAPSVRDVDYLWFSFGWRRTFRGSADAQSAFDSYVKK
jgi:hypothetical protein